MTATTIDAAAQGPERFLIKEDHHPENGTLLGFWLYLMSDCLIFAVLFAMYGVLGGSYAAGPSPRDLFDLDLVAVNTAMLLLSSITYGFAMLEMARNHRNATLVWLGITGLFGLAFVGLELHEFSHLIHDGAGPQRSRRSPIRSTTSAITAAPTQTCGPATGTVTSAASSRWRKARPMPELMM